MINKIQTVLMLSGYSLTIFYAFLTYSSIRQTTAYPYLSSVFALVLGLLWGLMTKLSSNSNQVYFLGAVWDVGVSIIWIIMPLLIGGVNLSAKQMIGVSLLVLGCLLIK